MSCVQCGKCYQVAPESNQYGPCPNCGSSSRKKLEVATDEGNPFESALQTLASVESAKAAAVAAEREACAQIAENERIQLNYCVGSDCRTVENAAATKRAIAARIRARATEKK